MHGYNLKQISFDPNNIMTGFTVINKRDNSENSMKLGGNFIETEKAEYTTKRLTKIGAAVLMQTIMSDYLSIGWSGENAKYGRIEYHGEAMNGYDPYLLEIPKNVDIDKRITNEYYQDRFIAKANNIAGRFGLNLEDIKFNENGILCFVEVSGQNGCYYNIDMIAGEIISHQYHCHNVDRPDQAAALHGIVASYINDLIEMNEK